MSVSKCHFYCASLCCVVANSSVCPFVTLSYCVELSDAVYQLLVVPLFFSFPLNIVLKFNGEVECKNCDICDVAISRKKY